MKRAMAAALCIGSAALGCASEPPTAHVARQQRSTTEPERTIALGSDDSTTTTVPPTPTTTTTLVVEEPTTVPPTTTATVRRTTPTTVYVEPRPATQTPVVHGAVPPDYIKQCESGGDYTAINPNGHYGAWQFSIGTWRSVGGTGRPDHATPAEQDYRAALLWDGGRGASHWVCA